LSTDVPDVDVQLAFEGRPSVFSDDCHFTEEGHREIANLIEQALVTAGLLR